MIDFIDLQKAVVSLIVLASGIANNKAMIIKGGKLSPITGQYCTVKWVSSAQVGKPSVKYECSETENILNEIVTTPTEFTLSINFYRDGAVQRASSLVGANYRDIVKRFLYSQEFAWARTGQINNLTTFFSGENEERAQVNLTLWADDAFTSEINQALSCELKIIHDATPGVIAFYADDGLEGADLAAFDNKP